VCENYPAKPWDGPSACGCGDAGMPCPACAREIVALPMIGDGALHRVIMQVRRQYFDAPDLSDRHAPRWSSRRANGVRAAVDG
jgi:hypothetical protein